MELKLDPSAETPATLRAVAALLTTLAGGDTLSITGTYRTVTESIGALSRTETVYSRDESANGPPPPTPVILPESREHRQAAEQGDPLAFLHADELAPVPASEIPLPPPAPSIAAAELFKTAPVAPPAGAVPPPPVPVPPAPIVPTPIAATVPLAPSVAVDKSGLPWDARIHSSTKVKNADGTWRARRNLNDDALVAQVEQELRTLMALPAIAPSVIPPPPTMSTAPTAVAEVAQAPLAPAAPATVPAAPIATVSVGTTATLPSARVPAPPAPPTGNPFATLMTTVTRNVTAHRLQPAQVYTALEAHGIPGDKIGLLSNRPDVAALVLADLLAIKGVQ